MDDWLAKKLPAALEAAQEQEFEWGSNDCACFAGKLVKELYGVDVLEGVMGTYNNEETAKMAIQQEGAGDLGDAVHARLTPNGFKEIIPMMAQRGDIALAITNNGLTVGIVGTRGHILLQAKHGIQQVGLRVAVRAWRFEECQ